jgi:hypothetical protein
VVRDHVLGGAGHHLHADRSAFGGLFSERAEVRLRLDGEDPIDAVGVAREVQPVAGVGLRVPARQPGAFAGRCGVGVTPLGTVLFLGLR